MNRDLFHSLRRARFDLQDMPGAGEATDAAVRIVRPVERAFRALLLHGWIEETKTEPGQRRVVLLKSPVHASTATVGEADE